MIINKYFKFHSRIFYSCQKGEGGGDLPVPVGFNGEPDARGLSAQAGSSVEGLEAALVRARLHETPGRFTFSSEMQNLSWGFSYPDLSLELLKSMLKTHLFNLAYT